MDLKAELTPEQYQKLKSKPREKQKEFVTQYVKSKGFTPKKSTVKKVADFGKGFAMGSVGKLATGSAKGIGNIFGEGAARVYEGAGIIGGVLGADGFESGMRSLGGAMRNLKQETGQASSTLSGVQNRAIERSGSEGKAGAFTGELATYFVPAASLGKGKAVVEGASKLSNAGRILSRRILPEAALDIGLMKSYDLTDNENRTTAVNTSLSLAGAVAGNLPYGRILNKAKKADDLPTPKKDGLDENQVKELAKVEDFVSKNDFNPNALQKYIQVSQGALRQFPSKLRDSLNKTWFDETKYKDRFIKTLDDIYARYSKDTEGLAEQVLDQLRRGEKVTVKDPNALAMANEINALNKQVPKLMDEVGYKKPSGEGMGEIPYYTPKDFSIPTSKDKLNKFVSDKILRDKHGVDYYKQLEKGETIDEAADKILKKLGKTRDDIKKDLSDYVREVDSVGNRFGKIFYSRDVEPPLQTRGLYERQKEYFDNLSKEAAKTANFGNQTSPGQHEGLENMLTEMIPRDQREYARGVVRAMLGEKGSKWDKKVSSLREFRALKEKNMGNLWGYSSGELLAEDGAKLANTLGSFIMGTSATLWDLIGNPARIAIGSLTDTRAMAQLFNGQFLGKAKEVEAAAKRMGLFDSQANILRDKDIELAPQVVDFYFKWMIGQKMATNFSSKLNIKAASAKLEGMAKAKKLTAEDITELKDEFGLTDELIKNINNLEMEDFIGAVIYNTTQKIHGRGGGELVMANEYGALMKTIYKFTRFPLMVADEMTRQAKRNPGKFAATTGGVSYGYGAALEEARDIDLPGVDAIADIMNVSEEDEERMQLIQYAKKMDEEMGTEDWKVFERTTRGFSALTGMDIIYSKIFGDNFGNPVEKVLVSPNIVYTQVTSLTKGLIGLMDGDMSDDDLKNLTRGIGAARDTLKVYEDIK